MTRRRERDSGPINGRRAAREFAFKALFASERGEQPLEDVFHRLNIEAQAEGELAQPLAPESLAFAQELAEGLEMNWEKIDELLHRTVRGWSFEQMSQVDLNLLRLAAFEMTHMNEPHPPVIESAVRIANKYGGEDSGRFVNGVLGSLSRALNEPNAKQS